MILDMDVGNSRCKWRLSVRGRIVREGSLATADITSTGQCLRDLPRPERVRVACVAAVHQVLAEAVENVWGLSPEFAQPMPFAGGVRNGYSQAAALGVDRWLALLAAWQQVGGAVVVVDAGTALTVDGLDASGTHQGGYIMPGLGLLHRALHQETAGVRYAIAPVSECAPGVTTADAVNRGVVLMAAAAVEAAVQNLHAKTGSGPVLLCGGDASIMALHLKVPVFLVPDMVLAGLAVALP